MNRQKGVWRTKAPRLVNRNNAVTVSQEHLESEWGGWAQSPLSPLIPEVSTERQFINAHSVGVQCMRDYEGWTIAVQVCADWLPYFPTLITRSTHRRGTRHDFDVVQG